ncbi:hypothetical protein GCM10027291_06060 [Telluribacter humicola]|uniref:hypothetical protein n=1 Tax=Telluribacter humicola TaxID=1720261 RepID=UPI001A975536|nr:hypothetical protein [Telluribacter humicola]
MPTDNKNTKARKRNRAAISLERVFGLIITNTDEDKDNKQQHNTENTSGGKWERMDPDTDEYTGEQVSRSCTKQDQASSFGG